MLSQGEKVPEKSTQQLINLEMPERTFNSPENQFSFSSPEDDNADNEDSVPTSSSTSVPDSLYIRPSKKPVCSLSPQCNGLCGKTVCPIITIESCHWTFCDISHFWSESCAISIKYLIAKGKQFIKKLDIF